MSEDPTYLTVVSLHLSRVLDEIGLNELTVRRRRETFMFIESMSNVYGSLTDRKFSTYHFGSQTEGTTTLGLNSDLDTLSCFHDAIVIQDLTEWQKGKMNLLMLQENTAPGYCRLQLLRSDKPVAMEDLLSVDYTYDNIGRVILKNTSLNTPVSDWNGIRNGPATSRGGGFGFVDKDYVAALKSRSWPRQATEFTTRYRCHGWPPQSLLKTATDNGCFLVPVGYRLSQTEHLEWRLSASLAERCLMFSLNIVQIKCYVVLKILVKTFVDTRVSKSISSYHCKTAVLYCTENTEPEFWREENLLQCITRCLMMLLTWISDGFCPNFILPEENLFAGKVTVKSRRILQSILTDLIKSKGRALLRVYIDDLGSKMVTKLSSDPSHQTVLNSRASDAVVEALEYDTHACINLYILSCLLDGELKTPISAITSVLRKIKLLKGRIGQSDKHEHQAVQNFIKFLSVWLGALLASHSLSHSRTIPIGAIQMFRIEMKRDVHSRLKLGSILYSSGDIRRAEIMLKRVQDDFCKRTIQPVCECYRKTRKMPLDFNQSELALKENQTLDKQFAYCVRFSALEIHCIPHALQFELFRSIGGYIEMRDNVQDNWMVLAVVDCLPYMYYLQYITYRKLGKLDLQKRSLYSLNRCIIGDNDFRHLETAWNLLGECMELEQEPEAALACYKTSLEIRPRNNAANWHVTILCYRLIKNRGLLNL